MEGFQSNYFAELDSNNESVKDPLMRTAGKPTTLPFSSQEPTLNSAYALKLYLEHSKEFAVK